jgi:hypothetical protein
MRGGMEQAWRETLPKRQPFRPGNGETCASLTDIAALHLMWSTRMVPPAHNAC